MLADVRGNAVISQLQTILPIVVVKDGVGRMKGWYLGAKNMDTTIKLRIQEYDVFLKTRLFGCTTLRVGGKLTNGLKLLV